MNKEESAEHVVDYTCSCDVKSDLTDRQLGISKDIQALLTPLITEYLDEKSSLIDALIWLLTAVTNDSMYELSSCCDSLVERATIELDDVEGEEYDYGGFICRSCAIKLNAVSPNGHICTWHRGVCEFCHEEANLCHTSDWNWPDARYLEEGREI